MTEVEYISKYAAYWRSPTVDIKGIDSLKYLTPVTPPEYLKFAETDLSVGGRHGYVNALSNAKRAIDCQVTNILQGFGLSIPNQFPAKLEKISALGLVAPRIVKKIVRLRNLLEHEFHNPNMSEVEDAVDIATLFIQATRQAFSNGIVTSLWVADEASTNHQAIKRTKTKTIVNNKSPKFTFACGIFAKFETESRTLSLLLVHENKKVGEVTFLNTDKRIIPLLQFLGAIEFDSRAYTIEGAREFLALIQDI